MARSGSRDLAVGAMFVLALIVLAVTIMAVGEGSRLFVAKVEYRVVFPNVDGLTAGSPVKMAGVQVGSVTGIRLFTDPAQPGIEVLVGIDRAYRERVREDSAAALRILQILSGEKFVEIVAGSSDRAPLPPGSRIATLQDPEVLEQVAAASQNLNDISVSLKNILGALERGEGLMGQMITDPEFGQQGLEALRGTLENLQVLTADLRQGEGFVGRMLYDESFAARLDDLGRAIEDLSALMEALDPEQGAVGALLQEDGSGQQAIEDLRDAAASLKRVAARLESDKGLMGRLLNDEEYSEGMAQDLRSMLANLTEITEKINRGEGTLGALVNERTLYDGAEDVMAGVNDSKFARWLLRHYQKKGIKIQDEPEPADEQPDEP